ncbi:restriction endonuclease subunit S [Blautia coccoides]|uniref:restriction endonuclease subunit S n=1 Tax=Blautia producta TaxID=33035 RepID=UPI00210C7EA3|nr:MULTISPECIES: restriction endonuclease subunit S [Blautia]MCQ5125339.1 restriction endonuclease subunit S [Blautia producta]MDT4374751.1 restriction endonuclease subunit S [Blautia coccoides]
MKYVSVQDLVEQNQVVIKTGPFGTQLKASEYVSFGTPVLNVRNLGFATVNTDKLEMVSDGTLERLSAHKLVTGDIVFGRKGAVERHAFISESENGWMQGSDCIRLRVLADSVNPRFLSYYFLTKQHRAFMMSMCSHGTTMASLNQKIIEKIIVPLPERSIQDKVVEILAALDKQIATNQKINENLVA